jgi:hypothetical protein
MIKIKVNKKTGFCCNDSTELIINDAKGKLFYSRSINRPKNCFNLPKGVYYTNNNLTQLGTPVSYSIPKLPPIEREGIIPVIVIVRKGNNPHKCSIIRDDRRRIAVIFADNKIFELPRVQQELIMMHELGHCFYETEYKCDLFSARYLIKRGYNPSQLALSSFYSLGNSDSAYERKCTMLEVMKETKMQNGK